MCVFRMKDTIYYNSFFTEDDSGYKSVYFSMNRKSFNIFYKLIYIYFISGVLSILMSIIIFLDILHYFISISVELVVAYAFLTSSFSLVPCALFLTKQNRVSTILPKESIEVANSKKVCWSFFVGTLGYSLTFVDILFVNGSFSSPLSAVGLTMTLVFSGYMLYRLEGLHNYAKKE